MKIISVIQKPWAMDGKQGNNYKFSCIDPSSNEAFIFTLAEKDVQLMCQVYNTPDYRKFVGRTVTDHRNSTSVFNGRTTTKTIFLVLQ